MEGGAGRAINSMVVCGGVIISEGQVRYSVPSPGGLEVHSATTRSDQLKRSLLLRSSKSPPLLADTVGVARINSTWRKLNPVIMSCKMGAIDDSLGPIEPLSVQEVAHLFRSATFPWWIAGGWGIDLYLQRQTRQHGDIDVLILRRDQRRLRELLGEWDLHAADPPGAGTLRPWAGDELQLPVHEIWGRVAPDQPWRLEIMLEEAHGGDWVFRRDPQVRRPIGTLGTVNPEGVPYIAPEVLLLFKAEIAQTKVDQDFNAVFPELTATAKKWLQEALDTTHPGHPWIQPP